MATVDIDNLPKGDAGSCDSLGSPRPDKKQKTVVESEAESTTPLTEAFLSAWIDRSFWKAPEAQEAMKVAWQEMKDCINPQVDVSVPDQMFIDCGLTKKTSKDDHVVYVADKKGVYLNWT